MISEAFKDILINYKIKDHNVALESEEIVKKIENEYSDEFKNFVNDYGDYNTIFTCLKGETLLRVPYSVVVSKEYENYNKGLFIGFSINPDKGLLYLKIDQGLLNIGGNFDLPFVRGEYLRSFINNIPEEFQYVQEKCAPGNVITKTYTFEDINEELLNKDFEYVVNIYEKLVPEFNKVIKMSFDEIVNSIDL